MDYSELCEAFGALSPDEQTLFIDARIDHASHGALCGEVQIRIFYKQNNDGLCQTTSKNCAD